MHGVSDVRVLALEVHVHIQQQAVLCGGSKETLFQVLIKMFLWKKLEGFETSLFGFFLKLTVPVTFSPSVMTRECRR